jgi:hypothetical protein
MALCARLVTRSLVRLGRRPNTCWGGVRSIDNQTVGQEEDRTRSPPGMPVGQRDRVSAPWRKVPHPVRRLVDRRGPAGRYPPGVSVTLDGTAGSWGSPIPLSARPRSIAPPAATRFHLAQHTSAAVPLRIEGASATRSEAADACGWLAVDEPSRARPDTATPLLGSLRRSPGATAGSDWHVADSAGGPSDVCVGASVAVHSPVAVSYLGDDEVTGWFPRVETQRHPTARGTTARPVQQASTRPSSTAAVDVGSSREQLRRPVATPTETGHSVERDCAPRAGDVAEAEAEAEGGSTTASGV